MYSIYINKIYYKGGNIKMYKLRIEELRSKQVLNKAEYRELKRLKDITVVVIIITLYGVIIAIL